MALRERSELIVVGAGVIGLGSAWRAARAGWQVTVFDPAPGAGASWVAGGMLAPVSEAWPGEEDLFALGIAALERWPEFAAAISADAGQSAGLHAEGTYLVATGTGDKAELDTLAGYLATLGREVEKLSGRELRRREPALGPDVRAGLSVPGDLSVDNRALVTALRAAAEKQGVQLQQREVARVLSEEEAAGPPGVELADGARVRADAVLIAAGAQSAALHPALTGLIRPVKGEILRLARRPGAFPAPKRTVRALVDGRPVYLVPRPDSPAPLGGLAIGATQSEHGFDTAPTVAGTRDLLRDAERILPGIAEFELLEAAAGLRPGSPDNLPLIGSIGPGVFAATGHHRNGILLSSITADVVPALLAGDRLPEEVLACDPARFAGRPGGVS